jgi:type II secretory pathway component GspD/PulD (secretin)
VIDHPDNLRRLKEFVQQIDQALLPKEISLRYVSVDDVADRVSSALTHGMASCTFDKEANSMKIIDIAPVVQEIRRFVSALDHEKFGMMWDLDVYQVLLSHFQKEGIDWEAIVSDYQAFPARQIHAQQGEDKDALLKIGTISREDFNILVDALETVGEVKKISMDNQCAVFGQDNKISIIPLIPRLFLRKNTARNRSSWAPFHCTSRFKRTAMNSILG